MSKTTYLFHFKILTKINDYIEYLKKNLSFKSNCELIEYILGLSSKNFQKTKKIIGDHQSKYEFIDTEDITRIDKYVRINIQNYKLLKKWHYVFNEYGMSVILRDIIIFFYNGVLKYGVDSFISALGKNLNLEKIKIDFEYSMTHLLDIIVKKRYLYAFIIENLFAFLL